MIDKTNIKKLADIQWLSRWAGSYTFIACSHYGPQYYYSLKKVLGINFNKTIFIHHHGTVSFFVSDDEFQKFGSQLAKQAVKDTNYVKKLCNELKRNTDILLPLMNELKSKIPSISEYKEFLIYFERHLAYHNFIKKPVDFLDVHNLQKLLPYFQDARKYSETIYSESEILFRNIAKIISKEKKYPAKLLTCLTQKEFIFFLNSRKLPKKYILEERYKNSILYFDHGKEIIFTGQNAKKIESIIDKQNQLTKKQIHGVSAYPGEVISIVRIILDPHKKQTFNQGDILVTGMTRPEFMSYIKKASAIITDVGGILCHAAITARELKIPCVVGTISATKLLKSGQKIKIDATKGIINNE
jgi:phosphoenolpyruvate synthase/pyruvate phosphate dikinase